MQTNTGKLVWKLNCNLQVHFTDGQTGQRKGMVMPTSVLEFLDSILKAEWIIELWSHQYKMHNELSFLGQQREKKYL